MSSLLVPVLSTVLSQVTLADRHFGTGFPRAHVARAPECRLHIVTSHFAFSSLSAHSHAEPLLLPWYIKAALINLEIVRATSDMRFTAYLSPTNLNGRFVSWHKIKLIQHLQREYVRAPSQSCRMVAWIDPDAFLNQPDVNYTRALLEIPIWIRRSPGQHGRAGTPPDVAMVAAVEHSVPEMLTICETCHFNGGVLLFNMKHPQLHEFLDAWWQSPYSGVCEERFARERLVEQECLSHLVVYNRTTRARFGPVIGEADFVTINTPAGRLVRHAWGHHRDQSDSPDGIYSMRMREVGLWHAGAVEQGLKDLGRHIRQWP